jgi:prepilin peptidase dependent protein B
VLAVITADLQRAGYHPLTAQMLESPNSFINPFANSLTTSAYAKEAENSCITYAYDQNQNGQLDNTDGNENYGFRLKKKAIEMRMAGWTCEQNGWHDLTDTSVITVTELYFAIQTQQVMQMKQSQVHIVMHAHLVKYPDIAKHVQTTVLLANYD